MLIVFKSCKYLEYDPNKEKVLLNSVPVLINVHGFIIEFKHKKCRLLRSAIETKLIPGSSVVWQSNGPYLQTMLVPSLRPPISRQKKDGRRQNRGKKMACPAKQDLARPCLKYLIVGTRYNVHF